MKKFIGALTSANFRIWTIGALVSNIGHWMQVTAQSWVVLTVVTQNDATAVGIVTALQFAPALIFTPLAGVVADKFERRKILYITQTLLALLALSVATILLLGIAEVWHLFISAALLGTIGAFDSPARQAIVADMVKAEYIANAVSISAASYNIGRLIGPAVGGFLITAFGPAWVFYYNAFAFLLMIVMILLLDVSQIQIQFREKIKVKFTEALRYTKTRLDLQLTFFQVLIVGIVGMNFPLLFSTMAVEFGLDADGYGIFSVYQAVGALVGAGIATRWSSVSLNLISWSAMGVGLSLIFCSLIYDDFFFGMSLIPLGLTLVLNITLATAFVQTSTDNFIRGRVLAIYSALMVGGAPLGSLVLGPTIDLIGPRMSLMISGIFVAIAIIFTMLVYRIQHGRTDSLSVSVVEQYPVEAGEKAAKKSKSTD